nr:hypothetical protein [Pseudomonas aeruginosa]
MKEGFARLFCTIVASSVFGPILVVYLHSTARAVRVGPGVAGLYQLEPAVGLLFVSAPLLVIAGLPAWWLIGAALRLFERDGDSWLGAFAQWVNANWRTTDGPSTSRHPQQQPRQHRLVGTQQLAGPAPAQPEDRAPIRRFDTAHNGIRALASCC